MQIKKITTIATVAIKLIFLLCLNIIAQNTEFRGYQVARYEGDLLNITYNAAARVEFKIKSIDANGRATATLVILQNKSGGSNNTLIDDPKSVSGTIDENGILKLSGPWASWQIAIIGRVNGDSINANYQLTGPNTQNGHFTVTLTDEKIQTPVRNKSLQGCSRFEGIATNTSYNQKGKILLEVTKVDSANNITIHLVATDGLVGDGNLVGKFDAENVLRLNGFVSGLTMDIAARIDENSGLVAKYILSSGSSSQNGTINAKCTNFVSENPPVNNIPQSNPPKVEQNIAKDDSINGAWKGTYTCAQGLTNFVLSLFTKDGTNVEGIFTFLLDDGANMSVLGSFKMKGIFNNQNGNIELKGVDWDLKPAGWEIGDISGKVSGSKILGSVTKPLGCTTFQLEKILF